ncbi:hypothetical protein CDD80_1831 [Ophiocordyceps camponoti-rufipedis]|uniref:Uncharacterized protein n=1 Tax=Ophiocordyceps camponoti-rufipedis TaxID=2004952 RepID=A0A2C5ZAA6_9HYPO|nr:hypothetical protein CDD80_1831 [Ophiocordyceps camponoti-rufipedis]
MVRALCNHTGHLITWIKHNKGKEWLGKSGERNPIVVEDRTFEIGPSDWKLQPPCTFIQDLSVDFSLSNRLFAGTNDEITIAIGPMLKPKVLARHPDRGFHTTLNLNLTESFGSPVVQLNTLQKISLNDISGTDYFAGDWWKFKGMLLCCANDD